MMSKGQDSNRSGSEWDEGENATGRRFHPRSNENKELKERAMSRRATTIFCEGNPLIYYARLTMGVFFVLLFWVIFFRRIENENNRKSYQQKQKGLCQNEQR